jgi:hypothetical protein
LALDPKHSDILPKKDVLHVISNAFNIMEGLKKKMEPLGGDNILINLN